jgi:hypothetical protein
VDCPPGKRVVSAGGTTDGEALLQQAQPNLKLTRARAQAFLADTPRTERWSVQASAICADRLPGLKLVVVESPPGEGGKTVSATCPGTTRVVGGSGAMSGSGSAAYLFQVVPDVGLKTVTVNAQTSGNTTREWTLSVYATCADPPAGLQRVVAEHRGDATSSFSVGCPVGKVVLGGGGAIFDISGSSGVLGLHGIDPLGPPESSDYGFSVSAGPLNPNVGHAMYFLRAIAICADA